MLSCCRVQTCWSDGAEEAVSLLLQSPLHFPQISLSRRQLLDHLHRLHARTHTHSLYFMTTPQTERKQLVCEGMKGREEEEWDLLQCGDLGHLVLALSHFLPQNVKQLPHLRPTLLLQRVMIETLRTNKNRKSTECVHITQAGWESV